MQEEPQIDHLDRLDKLAEALAKAQAEYTPLKKSKTATIRMKAEKGGGSYSYKYADLSDLLEATRPALAKHGLAVTQIILGSDLITRLIHSSGQFIESVCRLNMNLSPQEFGSFLTYYRRYTLGPMLGIAGEEDDDGTVAEVAHDRTPPKKKVDNAPPVPPKKDSRSTEDKVLDDKRDTLVKAAIASGWKREDVIRKSDTITKGKRLLTLQEIETLTNYFLFTKKPEVGTDADIAAAAEDELSQLEAEELDRRLARED